MQEKQMLLLYKFASRCQVDSHIRFRHCYLLYISLYKLLCVGYRNLLIDIWFNKPEEVLKSRFHNQQNRVGNQDGIVWKCLSPWFMGLLFGDSENSSRYHALAEESSETICWKVLYDKLHFCFLYPHRGNSVLDR